MEIEDFIQEIENKLCVKTCRGENIKVGLRVLHPSEHMATYDIIEGTLTNEQEEVLDIDEFFNGKFCIVRGREIQTIKKELLWFAEEIKKDGLE